MAKRLKSILISMFAAVAFLLCGVFFVGCNIDYSKISLVCDQQEVNLNVGEQRNLTFRVENYQNGFVLRGVVIDKNDSPVFSHSDVTYISDTEFSVTITAMAGGHDTLVVKTSDGLKECSVNINVEQTSPTFTASTDTFYVSEKSPFVPTLDMFEFSAHATDRKLSYFYVQPDNDETDENLNTYSLTNLDLENSQVTFVNRQTTETRNIVQFDRVALEENQGETILCAYFNNTSTQLPMAGSFEFLAVYDKTIGSGNTLFSVSDVYVLKNLDVSISGGYLKDGEVVQTDGTDGFAPITDNIKIVPNNPDYVQYLLRVEMVGADNTSPIEINLSTSNDSVLVDFVEFEEEITTTSDIKYIKISQNTVLQDQTQLNLEIFYSVARNIEDESVNVVHVFDIDTQIAPTAILINGSEDPVDLLLYNRYGSPDFGWHNLLIDVVSEFETSPTFESIYFEFVGDVNSYVDFIHNGPVRANEPYYESDLQTAFQIRGKRNVPPTPVGQDAQIIVHLRSDILANESHELTIPINCRVVAGVTDIEIDENFKDRNNPLAPQDFYIDNDGTEIDFSKQFYTSNIFQSINVIHDVRTMDVADFIVDNDNPYILQNGRYYLNLKIIPKQAGDGGVYELQLDNGTTETIKIFCKNPLIKLEILQDSEKIIRVLDDNESDVTYREYSRTQGAEYDDILSIEVLNNSTSDSVQGGSTATVEIVTNVPASNITPILDTNYVFAPVVSATADGFRYTFTTRERNGDTQVTFRLADRVVNKERFTLAEQETIVNIILNISTYSLVQEFYLKNGDNYAFSNNVYFGSDNIPQESSQIKFTAEANFNESRNFWQYTFLDSAIVEFYENSVVTIPSEQIYTYSDGITALNFDDLIEQRLVHSEYDKKFISFKALTESGALLGQTSTNISVTKTYLNQPGRAPDSRTISLSFYNGLMFWADDRTAANNNAIVITDNLGNRVRYEVVFSNIFATEYGLFNLDTFTYEHKLSYLLRPVSFVLSANLVQRGRNDRDWIRRYEAVITATRYTMVETISLSTSLTEIEFDYRDKKNLSTRIGVYTFPINSTNHEIKAEPIAAPENRTYADMIQVHPVDETNSANGLYFVTISALSPEEFYARYNVQIQDVTEKLEWTLYIYPTDWGDSYTSIPNGFMPQKLTIRYRNGREENPYLLETAQDVKNINNALSSHYELASAIDMTGVVLDNPIGVVKDSDGNLVLQGFSGSITGTTSRASITNVVIRQGDGVSSSNLVANINGVQYGGLFARINNGARVENVTISGKIDANVSDLAYLGLLTAVNRGRIINSGVVIGGNSGDLSQISGDYQQLYFGGVAGINYGTILQDLSVFDNDSGLSPRNMAYFNATLSITGTQNTLGYVYAGGVAGASSGEISRVSPNSDLRIYGYTGYSAYTRINISGVPNSKNKVALGGIVGVVSYYNANNLSNDNAIFMPEWKREDINNADQRRDFETGAALKNLLVGGKLNAFGLNSSLTDDYVGGIVGFVCTAEVNSVDILQNTSRVFIRGNNYVGGIVGFEYSFGASSGSDIINYEKENKFQAVDDGENNFYASSIITTNTNAGLPGDAENKNLYYMIGNFFARIRSDYSEVDFEVSSYVLSSARRKLTYTSQDNISTNSTMKDGLYGDWMQVTLNDNGATAKINSTYFFDQASVSLEMVKRGFEMEADLTGKTEIEQQLLKNTNVYFMYYFEVDSDVIGNLGTMAQSQISDLNYITPQSSLYPFEFKNPEVMIMPTSSNVLDIDSNGNITLKGVGVASVTITSVLNQNEVKNIYLYVVNFFNKNISTSIFFATDDSTSSSLENSQLEIYGDGIANAYLIPDYAHKGVTFDGYEFETSANGILMYKGVAYNLTKNTSLAIEDEYVKEGSSGFSSSQNIKQRIVFKKTSHAEEGDTDNYKLVPILQTTIRLNGKEYVFYYKLNVETNLKLVYHEKVRSIKTAYNSYTIDTNESFSGTIEIDSTNPEELLFYRITKTNDENFVQEKMPKIVGQYGENVGYDEYINSTDGELFDLKLKRIEGTNNFNFVCKINTESESFKNRFENPIEGEYDFKFFASELTNGVSWSFFVRLKEAELNLIKVNNYSDMNDVTLPDSTIIPGQKGVLEITLSPVEANFKRFTITNNEINTHNGSGEALFRFAFQDKTGIGVQFDEINQFGEIENGISFTYEELVNLYKDKDYDLSTFRNKIYITYFVASRNVDDKAPVQFDINVTYGTDEHIDSHVELTTKLESYARLVFDDKSLIGDAYYVARGLSYNVSLETFGFTESQVAILTDRQETVYLTELENGHDFGDFYMQGSNGKYTLTISSDPARIIYNGDVGYRLELNTIAQKVVDGKVVQNQDSTTVYVMEYVLNYTYVEGINEDIVTGMRDGIINVAVGNPYVLSLYINNFLEYDTENVDIAKKVENFVSVLNTSVSWQVVLSGQAQTLSANKRIDDNDYFYINGFTVTPIQIYNPQSDIYHFTVSGHYVIRNGEYTFTNSTQNSNTLYTEFSFNVHNQSTHDSPIPVRTYQDLMEMAEGQWYILLNDRNEIVIPNNAQAEAQGLPVFAPINTAIAGLDGNGCQIVFSGEYNFEEGVSNVGLFGTISGNVPNIYNEKYHNPKAILQNIKIRIDSNTRFRLNAATYNVGLLAAQNDGIVTNAEVFSNGNAEVTVSSLQTSTDSYVAGLIAQNNNDAYITNSRSKVNISGMANIAGFVGQNAGHIASSYFRGAWLRNNTRTTQDATAGFVISNTGSIYTSYVSGDNDNKQNERFYKGTEDYIESVNNVAGFVYTNSGSVQDCYTNIKMDQSHGLVAGFVFENSGEIERAFSTSVLQSERTGSYGFVRTNEIGEEGAQGTRGVIQDAFYLSHRAENDNDENGNVNVDIHVSNIEGVSILDIDELVVDFDNFDKEDNPFRNYIVANGRDMNSVWFYNESQALDNKFSGNLFNTYRIELVAPNIEADSRRQLYDTVEVNDPTTGANYVRYIYTYTGNSLGSTYNPILISKPEEFENYIVGENYNDINTSSYRLICDLDYEDDINGYNEISSTYKTKFMGYFEGNFMTISGNLIISSEKQSYGGLFAEIGSDSVSQSIATAMNFNYSPSNVTFSNTSVVGSLAGKVENARLYNISILQNGGGQDGVMIVGNNITGGAIGLTLGDYDIRNLYCQFGAKSRNQTTLNGNVFDSITNFDNYSFAGGYIGVMSGSGKLYNAVVDQDITGLSVLAGKAGLMFGLVDQNASIFGGSLDMTGYRMLNGYTYAGLVVGETRGTISDFVVNGSQEAFTEMRAVPYVPAAVGGFAGLVNGGRLSNIEVYQDMTLSEQSKNTGIAAVGGVAGEISAPSTLTNITVDADIVGFEYVGGVAGRITASRIVSFDNIHVSGYLSSLSMELERVGVGGLAGQVEEGAIITLTSSSETNNNFDISVYVHAFVYETPIDVYLGAIIGDNSSSAHSIQKTDSSIVSRNENAVEVEDLVIGSSENSMVRAGVSVTQVEQNVTLTTSGKSDLIQINQVGAANSTTYCNISSYVTDTQDPALTYLVYLSLYGTLTIPQTI